jgi:TPR repeat protein
MNNLGNVLARSDPPDLAAARGLWERAAAAGDTGAMANLGDLLAQLHPAGHGTRLARKGRGIRASGCHHKPRHTLLLRLRPPDLPAARAWLERAAAAGDG